MPCSNLKWIVVIFVGLNCAVDASSMLKMQHKDGFFVSTSTGYQMPTKLQYDDKAVVVIHPNSHALPDLAGNISSASLSSPFV